jgi:hypothetical protein
MAIREVSHRWKLFVTVGFVFLAVINNTVVEAKVKAEVVPRGVEKTTTRRVSQTVAYVTSIEGNTISVIDTATNQVKSYHTFAKQAWISLVSFDMSHVRLRGLPALPYANRFPELNVRTYVIYQGQLPPTLKGRGL